MQSTLFYVEDDEMLAKVTINALSRRGYEVVYFSSIAEARLGLNHNKFSHALLDMKLDDGNALELIDALYCRHESIKILLLTGYASIATAVQAVKLGAHNYLAKPASIEEILNAFGDQNKETSIPNETMSLKRLEWEKIQQALTDNDGNVSLTAKMLNMHRRTLQRKLAKRPVAK